MTGPLRDVLVADFSRVLAGPLATVMLADLGATVVKVERPGDGDDTRQWGPPWTTASSAYFECANRSKRSVELDLDDPQDLRLAMTLAERADVVVENFRTGSLDARGLGYEELRARNPGVVYCSITGFGGAEGAALPGYDFLVQAVGGLMSITGHPDGQPTKAGVALVDVLTSKDAVMGILAALRARDSDGVGQRIEVNLLSSLLGSMANQAAGYLATGTAPGRMGNAHPSISPYETLRCRDALLAVCCGNDHQFRRLAATLGRPALADDARFATNPARVANRAALVRGLEEALVTETAAFWAARLRGARLPAGQVGDLGDAFALAGELGLEPLVSVGSGRPAQVRHPVTYSRTPVAAYTAPPRLGEDNDGVRAWLRSDAPVARNSAVSHIEEVAIVNSPR